MTISTLKKHISYVTDPKGGQTAVLIDLKSKAMQEFWEDFIDTMTAAERQNEKAIPFEEFEKEYLENTVK